MADIKPWEKYQSQQTEQGPWTKYQQQSAGDQPAGLPAGQSLPGVSRPAVTLREPKGVASTVGSHLANMVTGPIGAFTQGPKNEDEARIKGTDADSGLAARTLGQIGLGAARILVQPTRTALRESGELRRAGGPRSSLLAPSSYDAYGNYQPTAGSKIVDAIPVIGPWARSYSDEVQQNGVIPATAGLATDVLGPKLMGKAAGALRKAAPSLAEGALKINASDRGYGKTIGRAALDETRGIRPSTVLRTANERLAELNPQVDAMAASYPGPVSIQPAIDTVGDAQASAAARNNVAGFNAIEPVRGQLTENYFGNNQPFAPPTVGNPNASISPMQTATGALGLKRGLRDQFVRNWSPDAATTTAKEAAQGASRAIDTSLDTALGPEFSRTNQRISSLIPVADAAEKITRSAEIPQALGSKIGKHTGALASTIAGGAAFGPAGAAAGLALPELISSPAGQMALARALNSRLPSAAAPIILSGGILTPRREKK